MSFSSFRKGDTTITYDSVLREPRHYLLSEANFDTVTLSDFITFYKQEIEDYFDINVPDFIPEEGKQEIICAIDISDRLNTMTREMRSKMRKAGKTRRDKMKGKYSYVNPFNRIHGYVVLENHPGKPRKKKTVCINIICTSKFSDQKGLGSWLMEVVMDLAKKGKYKNIVLEVGNQEATTKEDDMAESSSANEEEEEEEEEASDEEEEEEEDYEDLIDVVTNQLWRKTVRHDKESREPVYLLDEDYIREIMSDYIYDEISESEEYQFEEDDDEDIYSYGGYYYQKGKRECSQLMKFYERYGFKEDPKVNTEWKCFTQTPLPAMITYL